MKIEDNNRKILCDIAHSAFNVVNDLLSDDQNLSALVRSRRTVSHQFVNEETITNMLAIRLLKKYPSNIDFTLFTHEEESTNGADWYWRIESGSQAIHARVQAKRIQRKAFSESDELGYLSINHPQLGTLLHKTKEDSKHIPGLQAWLATYARYCATPPCGCSNLQECNNHQHNLECEKDQPSLWIANVSEIIDSIVHDPPILNIIEHSVRLDCILTCINNTRISGPSRKGFLLQRGLPSYKNCLDVIVNNPSLHNEFMGAIRIQI